MRKVTFSINITIDGFADHTAVIADDQLHEFYTNLLNDSDTILFGRKTYQLMESFWPAAAENPVSTKSMIEFANKINSISKIVFSKTLDEVSWNNTKLKKENLVEEVLKLKNQNGKNISIGSLSLASNLISHDLIDEFWFLTQPVILGKGKQLFETLDKRVNLRLLDSIIFNSGVAALHYEKNKTI